MPISLLLMEILTYCPTYACIQIACLLIFFFTLKYVNYFFLTCSFGLRNWNLALVNLSLKTHSWVLYSAFLHRSVLWACNDIVVPCICLLYFFPFANIPFKKCIGSLCFVFNGSIWTMYLFYHLQVRWRFNIWCS